MAKIERDTASPCTRGGDIYSLPEVIEAVVQHHGKARPFVHADLEHQVLVLAFGVQSAHRIAHSEGGRDRTVGRGECRHHCVTDRLDYRARFRGDYLVQHAEVRPHHVVGNQVADALVEIGGPLQIGEQEGKARDLEPLVDVERVGAVDVAKRLVGEQALRRQERFALAEEVMHLVSRDPHGRQHAHVGAVLEDETKRPGPHLDLPGGRLHLVEYHREVLALARGVAVARRETAPSASLDQTRCRTFAGSWSERIAFSPARQLNVVDYDFLEQPLVRLGPRKVDARTPEDLPHVLRRRAASQGRAPRCDARVGSR